MPHDSLSVALRLEETAHRRNGTEHLSKGPHPLHRRTTIDHAGGDEEEVGFGGLEIDDAHEGSGDSAGFDEGLELRGDGEMDGDIGPADEGLNERFGVEERDAAEGDSHGDRVLDF